MTLISKTHSTALRTSLHGAATALAMAMGLGGALADGLFSTPDPDFGGRIRASAAEGGAILAGGAVKLSGQNFKPGQEVTLSEGLEVLNKSGPFVADAEGKFQGSIQLPDDAAVGTHPLVVSVENPPYAEILELKISPEVPLSGAEKFATQSNKLSRGLYQSAYGPTADALFVTASAGRPPEVTSELLKVDPSTLEVVTKVAPPPAPGRDGGPAGQFAVYGVGLDNANGTVWATNTRQNTVAVYKQDDLSLVKQFEPGLVSHARDVVVDEVHGKAYVSATGTPEIVVFDTKTLEKSKVIEVESGVRGEDFSVGSLKFDAGSGKLFGVSLSTAEAVVVDTATDEVEKVFKVEGARTAIGVAYDPESKRLLVAGQGTDNLLIVDLESGKTLHNVAVGAGALNVAFDPVGKLAYVSSRDAGTVTVVDLDGNIVANLENAPLANHVFADGKGNVFAINKSRDPADAQGDRITRISKAK